MGSPASRGGRALAFTIMDNGGGGGPIAFGGFDVGYKKGIACGGAQPKQSHGSVFNGGTSFFWGGPIAELWARLLRLTAFRLFVPDTRVLTLAHISRISTSLSIFHLILHYNVKTTSAATLDPKTQNPKSNSQGSQGTKLIAALLIVTALALPCYPLNPQTPKL